MIKNMSKRINTDVFRERFEKLNLSIGEPASLHHGGASSMMTAHPQNVLAWFYDQAPSLYMHSRFALSINIKYGCSVGVDTNKFVLKPGEGIVVFPFQTHYIVPPEGGAYMNLGVTFALRDPMDRSLEPLRDTVFNVSDNDIGMLEEVVSYSCQGGEDVKNEVPHILSRFLERKLKDLSVVTKVSGRQELGESKYDRVVDYIRKHISEAVSIKDIANAENISIPHLRRLFKEKTGGLTVGRFILSLRIKRAYEMLMHTDLNVGEISQECGFSDQFVFSRAFKRFAGLSPINYRKNQLRVKN